jgi:thymidylate synthase (FAD)
MQGETPDDAERNEPVLTRRPVSTGAEAHLGVVQPMLDHGMIRLVDYMGDDAAICQAARTSYGKGTKSVSKDEGLIRYE